MHSCRRCLTVIGIVFSVSSSVMLYAYAIYGMILLLSYIKKFTLNFFGSLVYGPTAPYSIIYMLTNKYVYAIRTRT